MKWFAVITAVAALQFVSVIVGVFFFVVNRTDFICSLVCTADSA